MESLFGGERSGEPRIVGALPAAGAPPQAGAELIGEARPLRAAGVVGEARPPGAAEGVVSHPLRTVAGMESLFGAVRGGEPEVASAAGRGDGSGPDALGGTLPEVVFVGAADTIGRVLSLVNALVVELGGLSLEGAGRGVLRTLVAALGRVRASADAAEARTVTALDDLADGGVDAVEVLRRNAGSSHREARRRRQRAGTLAKMPKVTEALAKGDISPEHADALARAASATSAEAVDDDAALLAQVAAVPADRAGRHIQDWTQRHQDPADLHEQHLRQRRRRLLHFGDGDDGMFMAHAAFDRVLGAQFRSLINGIADRIWRAEGGRENPDARSVEQRRFDALAIAVGLHPGPPTVAAGGGARGRGDRPADASRTKQASTSGDDGAVAADESSLGCGDNGVPVVGRGDGAARPLSPRHQVVVVASAGVVSGTDPQGRCEIPGVGPIPQTELERLACGAELFGLLFSGEGEPLWHGRGERAATDVQRRALVVRDGGCVLCAAEPAWCEAHHIVPWAKPTEGPTDIDNLALLCTACHHRLHDHKRVLVRGSDGTWGEEPDPRYANGGRTGRRQPNSDRGRANDPVVSAGKSLACRAGPPSMRIDVSTWARPEDRIPDRLAAHAGPFGGPAVGAPGRVPMQVPIGSRAIGSRHIGPGPRGATYPVVGRVTRGRLPERSSRHSEATCPRGRDPPSLLAARSSARTGRTAMGEDARGPGTCRGCAGLGSVLRLWAVLSVAGVDEADRARA